jgi:hypothetical protein
MNPDPSDPFLRALFDDDAWRASCREAHTAASRRLRRRRYWRKLRASVAVAAIIVSTGWFVWHGRSRELFAPLAAANAPAAEGVRLQLALHLPMVADGPLTVRAYEPLSDWTLQGGSLAESSLPNPALLPSITLQ